MAVLVAALAAGCGGGDELPAATTRPIGAPAEPKSASEAWVGVGAVASDDTEEATEVVAGDNQPPTIVGLQMRPSEPFEAGREVWVRGSASDPEGDPITLSYRWRVNGDTVDVEGEVLDTKGLRAGDTVQVEVAASDGRLSSGVLASPVLEVRNAPPQITSQPGGPGADGVFRYVLVAEDPDGDAPLRFRLEEGPPGMTVTPAGGKVEWRLPVSGAGVYPIVVAVEDPRGGVGTQSFELTLGSPGS